MLVETKSKFSMVKVLHVLFNEPLKKRPGMTIEDFGLHSDDHFESHILGNGLYFVSVFLVVSFFFWFYLLFEQKTRNFGVLAHLQKGLLLTTTNCCHHDRSGKKGQRRKKKGKGKGKSALV